MPCLNSVSPLSRKSFLALCRWSFVRTVGVGLLPGALGRLLHGAVPLKGSHSWERPSSSPGIYQGNLQAEVNGVARCQVLSGWQERSFSDVEWLNMVWRESGVPFLLVSMVQ